MYKTIGIGIGLTLLCSTGLFAQHAPAKENKTMSLSKPNKAGGYGKVIKASGAMPVSELPKLMEGKEEAAVKLTGTVNAVCQKKGCWMETDLGNGQMMRVRFKDYAFFVPMDCTGKTFVAEGKVSWYETSVASLQHYAEDAGKSKEEIAAITQPKKELMFIAEGVIFP